MSAEEVLQTFGVFCRTVPDIAVRNLEHQNTVAILIGEIAVIGVCLK